LDGFLLDDRQWTRLRPLLPNNTRGVPRVDESYGRNWVMAG
jgi:transposase